MLGAISWEAYITGVMIMLGIWYGYVVLRFYRENLKNIFKVKGSSGSFEKRKEKDSGPFSGFPESFETLQDAEELYNRIINLITESNDRGISRAAFLNYLRFVMEEYPFVKQSALRAEINSLTVLETRKYPVFELDLEQMESLWESEQ